MKRLAIWSGILVALCLMMAQPAAASLGSESGTMSITFILPPFQSALQASLQGAKGLWTVDQPEGGLMIAAPDTVDEGQTASIKIYRPKGQAVTARSADGATSIDQVASVDKKGLVETSFSLVLTNSDNADQASNSVSWVVSAV